ncbi:hypothetical protein MBRU_07120 [Mycolicibacterium brumae DSM 44177]|nr:hypothetical protein MBRU_07120 [Mycolicibacterium brumae DSM 44177]
MAIFRRFFAIRIRVERLGGGAKRVTQTERLGGGAKRVTQTGRRSG